MAETFPPDMNRNAGKKRGGKSGKVADFRYKRPPQPDARTNTRDCRAKGNNGDAHRPFRAGGNLQRAEADLSAIGGLKPASHGEAYAALDLGTNNCRLLIARPSGRDFTVIDAFSRVVKLGEGLAASGRLSDAAMDRALSALSICADKLQRRNVRLARSVATEACRRAVNGTDFIERVRQETGIVLDIISAEEEARLAVLGCHILLEEGTGPAVIFDIGGGSTELVLVEAGSAEASRVPRILDWQSVPWGVVSLTDTVGRGEDSEIARKARYAEMLKLVTDSFAPFAARVAKAAEHEDIRLLGTSGTVTTLASLYLELPSYDRKAVDGLIVPSAEMRDISARLSVMTPFERATLPCIGQDRADLVVAGCAILESILDLWPARRLGVADRGIREGILRSIMAAERQSERSLRALQKLRTNQPRGSKPA
ncbi:Ppx/GppA phosphatase family protein [Porphyrobacter sp. AAP60]|uniref:Ppx/GppA phosphatase family protein n=1 Tax=Porphyrobacter sp. AAP60 TaxID=1523423 RepID=UPI0006B95FB6|nr:Ppx/GppA phosphatase family protein [Porphyrobacter sp. AAP60]KPF64671.1 exopolyphosphatase [Porphyrobacter sp. AAP60]